MHIKTISIDEFNRFQSSHALSNFYQTVKYGMLMAEKGYDYDLIGLVDDNNNIHAASLILLKPIGIKCFYGYAPRGFLIDYNNTELLEIFTECLKKYYYEKSVIFIKINPNIKIGEINPINYAENYNEYSHMGDTLITLGYKKLANNLYFEAQLPRFNAIIDLKNYDSHKIDKNTRNKIKKGIRKGLVFEKAQKDDLKIFYEFMKNKKDNNEFYYQDYYTAFEKDDSIDLFLVSIDYNAFLQNSQYVYNEENEKNNKLNNKLTIKNTEKVINAKMNSDKVMLAYKNDIMEATKGIIDEKKTYLAGALVIKHNDTASIIFSAYDEKYKRFAPNYFLHYSLIQYYKDNYNYLDLNGVVGDFKSENYYTGLNRFKLGFRPLVYEYLGEFDLIIDNKSYEILLKNGILQKTFDKKNIPKGN